MTDETRTLIAYRMQRALEALDEVALLLDRNHINTFVNRVYYACFYSITALLPAFLAFISVNSRLRTSVGCSLSGLGGWISYSTLRKLYFVKEPPNQ